MQQALAQLSNTMNPELNFTLTLEEVNLILAALQEAPAKLCNPLTEKLKTQAKPQIEALQPKE